MTKHGPLPFALHSNGLTTRTANEWRDAGKRFGHQKGQHYAREMAEETSLPTIVLWKNGNVTLFLADDQGDVQKLRFAA